MSELSNQNQNSQGKKRSSLGRGLGSLLGGTPDLNPSVAVDSVAKSAQEATTPSGQESAVAAAPVVKIVEAPIPEESKIWNLAIDRLEPNTQQPRQIFEQEPLKELAQSIKENGILQPIVARRLDERRFEIIAGERRWRAAQIAGLHEVPVILKKVTEKNSLELAILENIQRENLNILEEGEAYQLLMDRYDLTQQEVADKLGKDRSSIANSLRMLGLPAELKTLLRKNDLSAGHAKVLLGLDDAKKQIEIGQQVVAEKLSVRATEKLVAKAKTFQRQDDKPGQPLNLDVSKKLVEGLSSELQKLVGTKVTIDYADGKGKLQIHFYSDDQLTQIVEKIREAWEK